MVGEDRADCFQVLLYLSVFRVGVKLKVNLNLMELKSVGCLM